MAGNLVNTATKYTPAALALFGLMFMQGCLVSTDDAGPLPGTLIVDWTLDDFKDPDECRQSDVAEISIVITTYRGTSVGEYRQDCETFETSIDLRPGDYAGDATLLDPDGFARTTSVDLGDFPIDEGIRTVRKINFPPSSFD